jgi:hypothetical protein
LPYANDLVRLAVSAILDASEGEIKVGLGNVIDVILDGYRTCLREGGLPFVLEENTSGSARSAPPRIWNFLESRRRVDSKKRDIR